MTQDQAEDQWLATRAYHPDTGRSGLIIRVRPRFGRDDWWIAQVRWDHAAFTSEVYIHQLALEDDCEIPL